MKRPLPVPASGLRGFPALRASALAAALTCLAFAGIAGQTSSSPITISSDDASLWSVNPDNDSVSVFNVAGDANVLVAEVPVGDEPRHVAITPDDSKVYVANMAGGTVSVIDTSTRTVIKTIRVGAEPFGCVVSPDGTRLFVGNLSSDNVSVIDTGTDKVIRTIGNVGSKPAALAIQGDKLYVTQFLARLRSDARPVAEKEGRDDGKEGRVTVIALDKYKVIGTVVLAPLADTGFLSNGSVLDRIPVTDPPTFTFVTGAFPNLLQSIVIKNDKAYLANIGSSPNGPFRFNVNIQALVEVIDTGTDTDAGQTINLNRGVPFEPVGQRIFNTTPIAIAFKHGSDEGFVVCGGVDRLVRITLGPDGAPTHNPPAAPVPSGNPSPIIRVEIGTGDLPGEPQNSNPQGIVINSTDTRAYVFNYISRDVSVVDISGDPADYAETARIPSAALPAPGTVDAIVHHGKELFNTSIGPAGTNDNALPPAGRMSDFGWGNCYNCHPRGLTDGVTWLFPDGPRQAISMESTGEHPQPGDLEDLLGVNGAPLLPDFKQRALNWSAVREEVQDFELNIRAVSGGQGLIRDGLGVFNLIPTANSGRDADLDALAAYNAVGIRAPIAPKSNVLPSVGRALFAAAGCATCHGGVNWTRSQVDFTPPPPATDIVAGQLVAFLNNVGTFDPAAFNEVRGAGTNIVVANGALGLNIPSLLSVFAGAPYLHSGSAQTLDEVLENVTHRSAGTGGVDTLTNPADRKNLVRFLKSIDASTPTFP